jgi:hypothetical protein
MQNEFVHRDIASRANAFRRMARNMAALIPRTSVPMDEFTRAAGEGLCAECGLMYFDHPDVRETPTFHLLCNGRVVKT